MLRLITSLVFCLLLILSTSAAWSQPRYIQTVEGEFEDVYFDLQDNIVNLGLVVERTGDIGDMLERTAKAVEGTENPGKATYKNAKYLLFCSAKLTSLASRADPRNLSICPFIVYAFETTISPGKVSVGYRNPDFGNLNATDPLYVEIHKFLKQLIDTTVADY